jgi:hypothetical protein
MRVPRYGSAADGAAAVTINAEYLLLPDDLFGICTHVQEGLQTPSSCKAVCWLLQTVATPYTIYHPCYATSDAEGSFG